MDVINYNELAQTIHERKDPAPESSTGEQQHKEIISSILQEHRQIVSSPISQNTPPTSSSAATLEDHLASYAKEAPQDAQHQADILVQYTLDHGLREGVEKAAHSDPFVMDLYHDTLTEKLYQEMKERKLI